MKDKMMMMALGAFLLVGCNETNTTVAVEPLLSEPVILYTPTACCMGLTPECLACAEGITVEEWKEKNESTPKACCRALTPECLACVDGITVEEWKENNEQTN